jgi:MFS transporter, YNFM family, putative membrane transport protein
VPARDAFGLQVLVCSLVVAAFSNIYLTQPVLPVLVAEFGVSETTASLSVSLVILGIALATLPFGKLVDRYPLRPIIVVGAGVVAAAGVVVASTENFTLLAAARLLQGLFLPALTSCVAAYLANSLPVERLNVVMGSYVSATVIGGLGGRLLGGWLHPPLHWRYAFISASALLLIAALAAAWRLPNAAVAPRRSATEVGFIALLSAWALWRIYAVGFGAFWVFSATFNYLPFYLSAPPFQAPTEVITLLYLVYLVGVAMGPLAGRLSNRAGSGTTMVLGSVTFAAALLLTLIPSLITIVIGLIGMCAGFFATHAAAAGALNRRLTTSRGRANALYVLFYYVGGSLGIIVSGYAYRNGGWRTVVALGIVVLLLPLAIGIAERGVSRRQEVHKRAE